MRILHVTPTYAPSVGGAEHYLKAVSERLVARGHTVTVFTANVTDGLSAWLNRCSGLPREEIIGGVQVVRFAPLQGRLDRAFDRLLAVRGGWRTASTLLSPAGRELLMQGPRTLDMIGAILRAKADVVVSVNWYWPQAYQVHLARRFRRFALVGLPLFHTAQPWCSRPVYDRMLARCNAVIAMTGHEKGYAEGRGARAVDVAGAGVSPPDFETRHGAEVRARYGLGEVLVVGYVGQQLAVKGVAKLIEAMPWVWRWNPDVRLVLAGRSVADPEVEAALGSLSAAQRALVVQTGGFEDGDKASIFDAFDVFAMPSKEDSFGIVYLEAWLCGKPVIGARIGSTQCVIDEGRDGLLVDPENPEDIARGIVSLLSNRELRATMAAAGRAKTVAQHTWDNVTDRIEALYRRVAGATA
jgi:glycosyltransferase involved in cell wall biosynthesis